MDYQGGTSSESLQFKFTGIYGPEFYRWTNTGNGATWQR